MIDDAKEKRSASVNRKCSQEMPMLDYNDRASLM